MDTPVPDQHDPASAGSPTARTVQIVDADDPRVAPFQEVRERDVAGRENGFIAEGEVVLNVLARSRLYRARSLLIADKRVERLSDLIARFPETTAVYVASQAVMDRVAGFPIHRGILAFGERPAPLSVAALLDTLGPEALVLGLFGVSNHDNIGGIFRNAAAFGVDAVLLDGACCDPLYRKAIRVSVGGVLTVPFARITAGEDAVGMLGERNFTVAALSPAGAAPLETFKPTAHCSLLLGSEGEGLPTSVLERCHTLRITMAAAFDSLNVATTSGIALHHLRVNAGGASVSGAEMEPDR